MADFNPQPVEVLQAQFVEMIDEGEVYKLDFTGAMPHDLDHLPANHIFEFETGLQLCITVEQTPMIFIPAVLGRRQQQQAQRRMTSPDSQYLHASASWAEGYLQPGPDIRDLALEEFTDRLMEETLSAAFDQVNNGVALLRRFYAAPVAQYIDEEGFVHVFWDRYALVRAVIVPNVWPIPGHGMPSTQNGHDVEGITPPAPEPAQNVGFDCPHCNANIVTAAQPIPRRIECPACGQGIRLEDE